MIARLKALRESILQKNCTKDDCFLGANQVQKLTQRYFSHIQQVKAVRQPTPNSGRSDRLHLFLGEMSKKLQPSLTCHTPIVSRIDQISLSYTHYVFVLPFKNSVYKFISGWHSKTKHYCCLTFSQLFIPPSSVGGSQRLKYRHTLQKAMSINYENFPPKRTQFQFIHLQSVILVHNCCLSRDQEFRRRGDI